MLSNGRCGSPICNVICIAPSILIYIALTNLERQGSTQAITNLEPTVVADHPRYNPMSLRIAWRSDHAFWPYVTMFHPRME